MQKKKAYPPRSTPVVQSRPAPVSALGNPCPLDLGSFDLTTFMLSVVNADSNLIDSRVEAVILPAALFYDGIGQFAAEEKLFVFIRFSSSKLGFCLEKSDHLKIFESILVSNLKQEAETINVTNYLLLEINDFNRIFP
ncbi:unnamed protein product [Rotaria sp. Silwood1]|nr:unnamed protein product [Rotaria sp. Silwood1]CAF4841446.1 unnamed protein product [Rotaria sp. Silwood1]CAF4995422.1 unnamed protein product [Rotaria sp. Silwood1]